MTVLSRDAVVIIHGIGEQVPLETVRRFVGRRSVRARTRHDDVGVAGDADRVFSEPSPVGTRTDDRAYLVTWNHSDLKAQIDALPDGWQPQERVAMSDFYEFYWAPHYRSTTVGQMSGWITPILRRRRSSFSSPRLVGPNGWVRVVAPVCLLLAFAAVLLGKTTAVSWQLALVVALPLVVVAILVGSTLGLIGTVRVLALASLTALGICIVVWGLSSFTAVVKTVTVSAAAFVVLGFAAGRATRVLGDAARYLSARPDSVEENDLIRQQVLELLERLHAAEDYEGRRKRYDRIIVVGHSLGSVIAYDAVRLLWTRRYRDMVLPDTDDTSLMALALREAEQAGQRLAAAPPAGRAAAHAAYVAAQRQVQLVMRDLTGEDGPTRWIITDLVTLGCPLTYADAFMAISPDDLADRFEERSLASIPPRSQQVHSAAAHPYRLWVPDGVAGRGTTRWHHAAPFVCVEWTNLWFEHDIVGGPIGPHFGDGVTDTSLGGTKWLAAFAFAYPHSSYWVASRKSLVRNGSLASLRFLRDKVRRPPTLLLTARTTPTDERQRAIVQLLAAGDPGRPVVDVRLYVGATDAQRTGSYLAVGRAPLPTAETAQRMRALLGPQGRVALLTSPDLLTDSADGEGVETVRRIDPSAPTLRSEEVEEDSLVVES